MKYTQGSKIWSYRAIMALLITLLLFNCFFSVKKAEGANVYFDNVEFYHKDGDLFLKFFCKTTFWSSNDYHRKIGVFNHYTSAYHRNIYFSSSVSNPLTNTDYVSPSPLDCDCTGAYNSCSCLFQAGNVYTINLKYTREEANNYTWTLDNYIKEFGFPDSTHYIYLKYWVGDTEYYYFSEKPELTITFPFDGAEIAERFTIQGNYRIPENSTFDKLVAYLGYDINGETKFYEFNQNIFPPSGIVEIPIFGIPTGDYLVGYYFVNSHDEKDYFIPIIWQEIKIIQSIPVELPETGEIPPPLFGLYEPIIFYNEFSNYATPTSLYINLTNTIKPIILMIGENLTFFTSKFNQDTAKETGQRVGLAILNVRSYANNLNSFFGDLPVSEVLFFYLVILIVVAVFRFIKNLINLIKP